MNTELTSILESMIEALKNNPEQQDKVKLVKAYCTNPEFRKQMQRIVSDKAESIVNQAR